MPTAAISSPPDLQRRAVRLQVLTVVWMSLEALVALAVAWIAQSPALLGFGGDSGVELLSAIVVLWRFRTRSDSAKAEKWAARVAGILLLLLAVFITASSAASFLGYREPQVSFVGIVLLIVAPPGCHGWQVRNARSLLSFRARPCEQTPPNRPSVATCR